MDPRPCRWPGRWRQDAPAAREPFALSRRSSTPAEADADQDKAQEEVALTIHRLGCGYRSARRCAGARRLAARIRARIGVARRRGCGGLIVEVDGPPSGSCEAIAGMSSSASLADAVSGETGRVISCETLGEPLMAAPHRGVRAMTSAPRRRGTSLRPQDRAAGHCIMPSCRMEMKTLRPCPCGRMKRT